MWRDKISKVLVGRVCNSSARYQDNLFDDNAIPPRIIKILAYENVRTNGAVEAYIYRQFINKHNQLSYALSVCNSSTKDTFDVKMLIGSFLERAWVKKESG